MSRASRPLPLDSLSPVDKRLVEILLGRGDLSPEGACRAIREKAGRAGVPFFLVLAEQVAPDRLDAALRSLTEDYDEVLRLGGDALRGGSPARAISFFTRAILRHGRDPESYRARGIAHFLIGQSELALADLDRAVALSERNAQTHHARALVLMRLERSEEALGALDRAIELAPTAKAHADRGLILQARGEIERAAGDFERALARDPESSRARYQLAVTEYLRGRYALSAANLARVLASSPPDRAIAKNARAILAHLVRKGLVPENAIDPSVSFDFWARPGTTSDIRRVVSCGSPKPPRPRHARPVMAALAIALAAILAGAVFLQGRKRVEVAPWVSGRPRPDEKRAPAGRAHPGLKDAVELAITRVETGEIPASPEDSAIFSSLDYDDLVHRGIYTREEADLQRELDQALVARSLALKSPGEGGHGDER